MNKKRLVLTWTDILEEHGGTETIDIHKEEHSQLSISGLIKVLDTLLITEFENKPFRARAEIRTGIRLQVDNEFIVYDESNVNYKDLLVALVTLMFLTNIGDRPSLIIQLAHCLRVIDDEASEQFRKDIAERVYRKYR